MTTFSSIPEELKRAETSLRAAKRNVEIMRVRIEKLEKVHKLADELCTAIDLQAEDIGGSRNVLEIVRDLAAACDKAKP